MSLSTNGLVLSALSILACGYLVYDAPLCRLWWVRIGGYTFYFRILVAGLFLFYPIAALVQLLAHREFEIDWLPYLSIDPQQTPIFAVLGALIFRLLAKIAVWIYALDANRDDNLNIKRLDAEELATFVYRKAHVAELIMVSLKNGKVYAGWPREIRGADSKWLRLIPEWSGHRDAQGMIAMQTNYAKIFSNTPYTEREPMLILVQEIVTVQPFDAEIFMRFAINPRADH